MNKKFITETLKQLYRDIDRIDTGSTLKYELAKKFEMKVEEKHLLEQLYQKEKILQLIRNTFMDIDFHK